MSAPPTVTNSPTPPLTPDDGDLWFNVLTGRTYVWYIGPSGVGTWVETQPTGGALVTARSVPGIVPQPPTATPRDVIRVPEITVSPIPPINPLVGDLWWSPITGMECIWYDDGNSVQWVQTQPVKYINLATLAGPAGGDLTGMYPNPQIIPGVIMEAPQTSIDPPPGDDSDLLASTRWVAERIAGLTGLPIPPTSVPYGDPTGQLTGDAAKLSFDDSTGLLTVNGGISAHSLSAPGSSLVLGAPAGQTVQSIIGASVVTQLTATELTPAPGNTVALGDATNRWSSVWTVTLPQATNNDQAATTAYVRAAIAALPAPPGTLPPSGPAGGGLTGTYPNPLIAPSSTNGWVLTTIGGVASWTPLPSSALPTGPAGGALNGTYPNPGLVGGPLSNYAPLASPAFTGTPTVPLASGSPSGNIASTQYVANQLSAYTAALPGLIPPGTAGQILTTVSGAAAWANPPSTAPSGPAGGDLAGTYPNPTIKPSATNGQVLTTVGGVATWAAGGSSISVGVAPPGSPTAGALWWNSENGQLFIYYDDGNSQQWVPASPAAGSSQMLPPGSVIDFAGATIPAGFLACLGQAVSRTTYAALFAAIGVLHGPGDGSTTFNVPDYGGRVGAGRETTATRITSTYGKFNSTVVGATGGDERVQTHNHATLQGTYTPGVAARAAFGDGTNAQYLTPNQAYGAGNSENVQPTIIVNKLIKY